MNTNDPRNNRRADDIRNARRVPARPDSLRSDGDGGHRLQREYREHMRRGRAPRGASASGWRSDGSGRAHREGRGDDRGGRSGRDGRGRDDRGRGARPANRRSPEYRDGRRSAGRSHARGAAGYRGDGRAGDRTSGERADRGAAGRDRLRADGTRGPGGNRHDARSREAYMDAHAALAGSILSPRFIRIVLAVALALAIAAVVVRCAATSDAPTSQLFEDVYASVHSRADVYRLSEADITERLEAQGVESTWAEQAASMAQGDSRFMRMALYSDELGREGSEVTNKIVKLAVSDPEAVDYAVDFIEKYPQESAEPYTETVRKGEVPRLYQWDERWAYITYSSTTFGCTGCGPTSLSMVYMAVTGKNDKSPADMAQLASRDGFETEYEGTTNQFFTTEATNLGLNVSELDVSSDALSEALEQGMPVICNIGPGDFTLKGHFFVITSLNEDGTVNINDPFSSVNSARSWDMDQILNQTITLYAYYA